MASPEIKISAHVNILRGGNFVQDVPLETGTVTMDRTAAVRRTCSLTITPQGAQALDPSWKDSLAAAGNEVRPWWVINYPDGTTDEVSLGTFTIVDTSYSDAGTDLTVKVVGNDRSWIMQQNKLLKPYKISGGISVEGAIQQMITDNWTGSPINFNLAPSGHTIPSTGLTIKPRKTIWSQALMFGASIGYELFIDPYGTVTGVPVPNPLNQSSVATITAFARSGLKTATAKSTRKGVYSAFGITATGSVSVLNTKGTKMVSKSVPIYASAYDTDPNSPTYYLGAFGTVATSIRSTVITTQAQGQDAVNGYLLNQKGAMTGLQIGIIPLPLLDAYDVITVDAGRVAPSGTYVIDAWTATMKYDASMDLTIREVY